MDDIRVFLPEPEKAHVILVVDDDVHVLKSVTRMLGSLGYARVFQAASAEEARSIWNTQSNDIQLVISDFVMPGETGDSLALDMQSTNSALKVLLISGNDPLTLDSAIALHPGVNFLQKPFTVAEMRKSLETLSQCSTSPKPLSS
jgi:two-component system, cell cycle sensor histidine kinase and response regulator CckA